MIKNPLGFAGQSHQTMLTRHGWSKALQLPPDLYPGAGGKRFRATLLQRAYELAGGEEQAPAAVIDAVELLHAGSLVIDDFEDDSQARRGQPALHRVIGAGRSVNAGNWMYFRALELAGAAHEDPAQSVVLLKKFIEVARQCHEGQAIDLSTRVDEVTPLQAQATVLAISRWKTGRLVSLAAWCGGHAAFGTPEILRAIASFGCHVGICLQMKNDLDELREFIDGGERCDDLKNKRVTWPWAWAAASISSSRFANLQRRLRKTRQSGTLRELAEELTSLISEQAMQAIDARLNRAVKRVAAATNEGDRVQLLADVADSLRITSQPVAVEAGQ